ncbi:Crp/Fnr family transcriptional regulator [Leptospira ilyithenensis]|uniref:Cyclic nucleotide-binding domain-containing protein n=1 Tax=Leptospira ilyithenensis TaxID=2484901 RepID=A0A4R9LQZ2_9LEPT|nr:cyclic nucleotide-binding domain-containing protein [Leptospira ilyithenensis]TGN12014.1 cyclic nucleotide-binding domain-containing protein [Leptospira ilyithenensis]
MSTDHLKRFLSEVSIRHFPKDQTVFQEGEETNGVMYFIFSGKLKVTKKTGNGEDLIIRQMGPGEFFGELALIQPSPRAATVIAIAEDTKLGIINREIFLGMGKESPAFLSVLLHSIIRRLSEVEEKVTERKEEIYSLLNQDSLNREPAAANPDAAEPSNTPMETSPPEEEKNKGTG